MQRALERVPFRVALLCRVMNLAAEAELFQTLCRSLCRNPVIPQEMWLPRRILLHAKQETADRDKGRMNTTSRYRCVSLPTLHSAHIEKCSIVSRRCLFSNAMLKCWGHVIGTGLISQDLKTPMSAAPERRQPKGSK
jgi:hypothetical protein